MRRTLLAPNESNSTGPKSTSSRGRRRLAFFLFGLGSCLTSFAQSFVAEWNAAADGGVGPVGLALATEDGTAFLYVADQPRGRILKLNATTGAVVATLGRQGNANGELNSPYGIAFDPASGDLYVAERGNNRISRMTKTGAFVLAWGSPGTANGQFREPVGVAVDASGDVYVSDHGNNRVQKFHVAQSGGVWSATHLLTWGSSGPGNGQSDRPYGITADAAGNIGSPMASTVASSVSIRAGFTRRPSVPPAPRPASSWWRPPSGSIRAAICG